MEREREEHLGLSFYNLFFIELDVNSCFALQTALADHKFLEVFEDFTHKLV